MTHAVTSTELKHALRKMDFPFSAQFALTKIEELCTSGIGRPQNLLQADLALELISEFVFYEVDRRGTRKRKRLTAIQELQLLQVLCDYFTLPGVDEAVKNAVFMLLFNCNDQDRSKLLAKLVSMAISLNNSKVLRATAVQMQQLSCTSKFSLQLSQALVNDYFVMLPKAVSRLQDLPKIAPLFTANFLTSITEIYYNTEKNDFKPPPKSLLEVITQWILNHDNLCMAALLENLQPALPLGAIPMPAIAPYAGLIKWCVLSPLWETDKEAHNLYSQLHLCLLNSLVEHDWKQRGSNIVSVQNLTAIVPFIQNKMYEIDAELSNRSINMLAQALHIALYSKAVYGNKQDLLPHFKTLTYNRLMKIVLKEHSLTL